MGPAILQIVTLCRSYWAPPKVRTSALRRLASVAVATACLGGILLVGPPPAAAGEDAAQSTAESSVDQRSPDQLFQKRVQPLLRKYCFECHDRETEAGGIALDRFADLKSARRQRDVWERVKVMLDAGAMPPEEHEPRPDADETAQLLGWMDDTLFAVDCELVDDPGRVTIRRLNRNEYNNTIRDLVGVDFEPAKDFPSDDVGYGFDNIGDVLSLSPLLMEKYLTAAEQIVEEAIEENPDRPLVLNYTDDKLHATGSASLRKSGFYSMSSYGSVYVDFRNPATGMFTVRIEAAADQAGPEPAKMELQIDGEPAHVFEIEGHRDPKIYETQIELPRGERRIAAVFINDYYNPDAEDPSQRDRNLAVRELELRSQDLTSVHNLPATHHRVVFCRPDGRRSVRECATQVLQRFATRAYRRPVAEDELAGMIQLVEMAVEDGHSFEHGIQLALQAILVSPNFLFRVEGAAVDEEGVHRIGQYELASRLSYFLWSSMPDEELFAAAEKGTLHRPEVLETQVRRMLADRKSQTLIHNFASQWLNLRKFDDARPNLKVFEPFDYDVQTDMRRETELFVEHVISEDRSILEFLTADYTFLNGRLAEHYGIEGVEGDDFRRVSLDGTHRSGVLTQGSILTLTSDPTRTSPVKRGKWILENILGAPPPPPPANVPALEETKKANPDASLREQLALHRTNAVCASCHRTMDPLGLGFENFDGVGRWRDKDGEQPVDASGTLPGGESFDGPRQLIELIASRHDEFARHFTATLLTFALGRGLEYYDQCTVDDIVSRAAADDYRFSAVVLEVCQSDAFLMRRANGGDHE